MVFLRSSVLVLAAFVALAVCRPAAAADESTRYGPFNLLDHRSTYGQFWFPEPLRAPEMDVDNEIRFDWLHTESRGRVGDEAVAEFEKAFGLLTLELEVEYERETEREIDPDTLLSSRSREEGLGAVEMSARYPVYQWVSSDEVFDFTLVPSLEVAVPTGTDISKDFEVVPQMFGLLRIGQHFALQTSAGYSFLIGPEEGGNQALEYSAVFAWVFQHGEIPLPKFVQQFVPEVEVIGERGLNRGNYTSVLTGTAGFRANLDAIGPFQPRLGFGYVFPIDQGARDEFDWGVISSFVLEY